MQKQLNTLMQREVSRKEFLATMGFGLASIFGFSTFLKLLGAKGHLAGQQVSSGYGSSAYGGFKR